MRSSTLVLRAVLAFMSITHHLVDLVSAQATPPAWSPAVDCNYNGNNGGRFTDGLGAVWDVTCAQSFSEVEYDDEGTNGQGIYGCMRGCDERPACIGFVFRGSITTTNPPKTGTGRCRYITGTTLTNSAPPSLQGDPDQRPWYGNARLVTPSPQRTCASLNNQVWTFASTSTNAVSGYTDGQARYGIFCAKDSSAAVTSQVTNAISFRDCANRCDALSTCTGFSYQYEGNFGSGPPKDGDNLPERATCYFRSAAEISANVNANTRTTTVDRSAGVNGPYNAAGGLRRDFAINLKRYTPPAATTPSNAPNTAWVPASSCSAGGIDAAGGRYTDRFGAVWEVRCASGFEGTSYETAATNGQGIYGCWKGCNNRPGCTAFTFTGTYDSGTTGTGSCSYFRTGTTTFPTLSGNYAAARRVTPSTGNPCPNFSGATFTTARSGQYLIACGKSSSAAAGTEQKVENERACLALCDASTICTGVTYQYGPGAEPTDTDTPNYIGKCFFRTTANPSGDQDAADTNFALKQVAPQPLPDTTSSSSTSTSISILTFSSTSTSVSTSSSTSASSYTATATSTGTPTTPDNSAPPAWAINTNCNALGNGGGRYTDKLGAVWDVTCYKGFAEVSYDNEGTQTKGINACFRGCDDRPACLGFVYTGTVTSNDPAAPSGSGRCYFRTGTTLTTVNPPSGNTEYYANARLISGATQRQCPRLNGGLYTYTSTVSDGGQYSVACGKDSGATVTSQEASSSYDACAKRCDAISTCTGFSYKGYEGDQNGGIPQDGVNPTRGMCYFRSDKGLSPTIDANTATSSGTISGPAGGGLRRDFAINVKRNVVPAPDSSSSSTSTSSTSDTDSSTSTSTSTSKSSSTTAGPISTATCTLTPNPPSLTTLSCADTANSGKGFIGEYIDACGSKYQVYCGADTTPAQAGNTQASNIHDCMLKCDAYPSCAAAVLAASTCYFKTSFTGITTLPNAPNQPALVRYVPPNPNYAAPVTKSGGGCGKTLPSGLQANGPSVELSMTPSDGILRTYRVHIPQYYDINKASPIIFGFHGNGGTSLGSENESGFNDGQLNPYAIAVYVQGAGNPSGFESNPDYSTSTSQSTANGKQRDRDFLKQLVASMKDTFCVDDTRVFAFGHSNGGGFCGTIACDPELSRTFAAIAPNSGAFYTSSLSGDPNTVLTDTPQQIGACNPGRNDMAIFETHGTADDTISYTGGVRRSRLLPTIPHWLEAWAERQGLPTTSYDSIINARSTLRQWGGPVGHFGRIQHIRLQDWTHNWPNGQGSAPINVSPYMMDFFYRWTDPQRGLVYQPGFTPPAQTTSTSSSTSSSTSTSSSDTSTSSSTTSSSLSSFSSSSSSSTTDTTSSTSSSSSATTDSSTTSSTATPTSNGNFPASCPAENGKEVVDLFGDTYRLLCSNDPAAANEGIGEGFKDVANFNECFAACHDLSINGNTGRCTGFTFLGADFGAGSGTCYLKTGSPFTEQPRGNAYVGAIRLRTGSATQSSTSSSTGSSTATDSASVPTISSSTTSMSSDTASSTATESSSLSSISSSSAATSSDTASLTATESASGTSSETQEATPTAPLDCPRSDGQLYSKTVISEEGVVTEKDYQVFCYVDYFSNGNNDRTIATDLANCIDQCVFDLEEDCWSVSWVPQGQPFQYCYYKKPGDTPIPHPEGAIVFSAGPFDPSYVPNPNPNSSSTTTSATSGTTSNADIPTESPPVIIVRTSSTSSLDISSVTESGITSGTQSDVGTTSSTFSSESSSATDSGTTSSTSSSSTSDTSSATESSSSTSSMMPPDMVTTTSIFSSSTSSGQSISRTGDSSDASTTSTAEQGQATTTTASSSSSSASTGVPAPISFPYKCPENNGQILTVPSGQSYVLACGRNTNGALYSDPHPTAETFNECLELCSAATRCTSVVWFGGANGVSDGINPGQCQLREGNRVDFNGPTNDLTLVAAIDVRYYAGTIVTTTTTTATSSLSTSSSVTTSSTTLVNVVTTSSTSSTSESEVPTTSPETVSSTTSVSAITDVTGESSSSFSSSSSSLYSSSMSMDMDMSTTSSSTEIVPPVITATTSTTSSLTNSDSVPTLSLSSSSTDGPVPTAFPFACPANDGQRVTAPDRSAYVLSCGRNTNGGIYTQRSARTFNECFNLCATDDGGIGSKCTGFVFFGGTNGVITGGEQQGFCQLKEGDTQDFVGTSYDSSLVAAIRVENYAGNVVTTTSSSSTIQTSTGSGSSSSIAGGPTVSSTTVSGSSISSRIAGGTTLSSSTTSSSISTSMMPSDYSVIASSSSSVVGIPIVSSSTTSSPMSMSMNAMPTASSSTASSSSVPSVSTTASSSGLSTTASSSTQIGPYPESTVSPSSSSVAPTTTPSSGRTTSIASGITSSGISSNISPSGPVTNSQISLPSTTSSSLVSTVSASSSSLGTSSISEPPVDFGSSTSVPAGSSTPSSSAFLSTTSAQDVSGSLTASVSNADTSLSTLAVPSVSTTSTATATSVSSISSSPGVTPSSAPISSVSVSEPSVSLLVSTTSLSVRGSTTQSPPPASTSLPSVVQEGSSSSSQVSPPVSSGEGSTGTSLSPTYVSISTSLSEESPIPTCGTEAGTSSEEGSLCQDPYGNTYNVTYGSKQYVGKVTKRAVKSNVNECLVECNLEPTCVGANYVGDVCTLFSEIIGTTEVTTGPPAVAATRPPDVSTVYTAPRSSVSAFTTSPQPPVYGSSSTASGTYTSRSESPGSSPAISTPWMTSSSSRAATGTASGSSSSVVSVPGGSQSASGAASSSSVPNAVSPPSQYTSPGAALSTSISGVPSSYSNPGNPSISISGGDLPGSSSGMSTSVSPVSPASISSYGPTPSSFSSSRGATESGSGSIVPSASTSGGSPPIYGSSSSTKPGSNNPPPVYGSSSSTTALASNNSPPPYGATTTSSVPSNNSPPPYGGSAIGPAPTTSSVTPPAETLCPAYDGRNYTDSQGASYTVMCGKDFAGTPFNPAYRRQAMSYNIQSCMAICDQYFACVAVSTDGTRCNLFSSVTGSTDSPGFVAAFKVSGPPNIQTVTVCANSANRVTAYTTVTTTATLTTCPANSTCTAGPNGFIARNGS